MKVLVTGGRDFADREWLFASLDRVQYNEMRGLVNGPRKPSRLTHIIHGSAKGADTLAGEWAQARGIQEVVCAANWEKHGKGAGHIRNAWMLDLLDPMYDIVMPCPGGKGTQGCMNKAHDLGLEIYIPYGQYENQLLDMKRIARGNREEQQEAEEGGEGAGAQLANGAPVPNRDPFDGNLPAELGDGIPGDGPILGGWGGIVQAQEAVQGRLFNPVNGWIINRGVRPGQVPR